MTMIDQIDTRSTWQRQLERPFIIARKLAQLRTWIQTYEIPTPQEDS